jgi:hypothetical protein
MSEGRMCRSQRADTQSPKARIVSGVRRISAMFHTAARHDP